MHRTIPHNITHCTTCPHTGEACRIGYELARKLCQSITAVGDMISDDFEITGHVEMVGCKRPCTGAFYATKDSCHMFGDVAEGADVEALMTQTARGAAVSLEVNETRLM